MSNKQYKYDKEQKVLREWVGEEPYKLDNGCKQLNPSWLAWQQDTMNAHTIPIQQKDLAYFEGLGDALLEEGRDFEQNWAIDKDSDDFPFGATWYAYPIDKPAEVAQGESDGWISVKDRLPAIEKNQNNKYTAKWVWGWTGKTSEKVIHFPDKFKQLDVSDWDGFDIKDYHFIEEDTEKECYWLKSGWYQELYNYVDDYYFWQPITITHWQPLPAPPKQK